MAKKRKSRASEPQQQPEPKTEPVPVPEPEPEPEQEPEPEPEPVQEEQVVKEEEEVEGDEEEEEEQGGGEEEEGEGEGEEHVDYEDNKDDAVLGGDEKKTLENASIGDVSANGEEGKEEEEEEPIEKLLEPFTKDQLVTLLKEAVDKHPDFTENVKKLADADPVHRKIFIHGLGWDTTAETLVSVYGKYGEIEDCKAVVDKATGKSKGYGFILFKHRSGAKRALKEPQKKIGNRMTSCQLASTGPGTGPAAAVQPAAGPPVSEYTQRKIFVSNVGPEMDTGKLYEFFSKFGEIEEGPLGLDKQTGKPKGFCLFVYKTIESAKSALEEPHKNFEGHMLHCQKAVDGPKGNKGGGYYQQQHHRGQHHSQQPYYGHSAKKGKYSGSSGGSGPTSSVGHMMAPAAAPAAAGYNPAVSPAALTPALGQALALLATQGAGMGLGNLLGGMGAPANPGVGVSPSGYGGQGSSGYGMQPGLQSIYPNPQMGQGGVRPGQGGAPYMGHGH